MKKRFGFTLAEVLITLGIIGVVAAMTIPTLIANTNSARFRSQFKKSISTLSQAGLMAQAQYDIDYSTPDTGCTSLQDDPDETYSICAIFNGTLSGHILGANPPASRAANGNYNPTVSADYVPTNPAYLSLADGSLVVFSQDMTGCHRNIDGSFDGANCVGYIDVNGTTLPNREVSCDGEEQQQQGAGAMLVQPAYAEGGGEGEEEAEEANNNCFVPNDARHMTDIFPIRFHDGAVEPASPAARYVLSTSK